MAVIGAEQAGGCGVSVIKPTRNRPEKIRSCLAEAIVRHSPVLTLAGFWRQHVNHGRGAVDLPRARVARGMPGIRIEPISFYWGLVTYPLRQRGLRRELTLAVLLAWSQVANASGFFSGKLAVRTKGA